MADISVIGAGYVGLTTGACFAHLGHNVVVADVVQEKIDALNAGRLPILEAGLHELVREATAAGRLRFVLGAAEASRGAEFHYLCVPTPQSADGAADLSYLKTAAAEIAAVLAPESVVVNKSTVPVGTTTEVEQVLGRSDVAVVSNPEFLREGSAVQDFLHPDRIVVGSENRRAAERVAGLYEAIDADVIITDPVSSELIKYASNAFLATKLTFANEMATLCERVGADVHEVMKGMGRDQRIGSSFLNPGPGWGGSCFPKDTAALVRIADDADCTLGFIEQIIALNNEHMRRTAAKVAHEVGGSLEGAHIAVWGLTFKAGTDDLRESPAIEVIRHLIAGGASVTAHDPAVAGAIAQLPTVEVVTDPLQAVRDADALVVLTEWPEFTDVDMVKVEELMSAPIVIDARNLLDRDVLQSAGFRHVGMGR